MSRVFWGKGALGSLVTGRLNNLTPEGLAIYWNSIVELAAVTRQYTFCRLPGKRLDSLRLKLSD